MIVSKINRLLESLFGIRIARARRTFDSSRQILINGTHVDYVIDGGANQGQWAAEIKRAFPELDVISIEPIFSAFEVLQSEASKYSGWIAINAALGDKESTLIMHVASNDAQSSSLLKPKDHLEYYPTVSFEASQETKVIRLDSLQIPNKRRVFLKLDLQGYELIALRGAKELLKDVYAIELEMTTIQMYQGQSTFLEVASHLSEYGFEIFSFADAFRGPDGRSIYIDVLFRRL
jgi:FkbM family methyltransferase